MKLNARTPLTGRRAGEEISLLVRIPKAPINFSGGERTFFPPP